MPLQIIPTDEDPLEITCDALIVGAFQDNGETSLDDVGQRIDGALEGYLSEHLTDVGFKAKTAKVAELATMRRIPARSVCVVGLGPRGKTGTEEVRRAAAAAARSLSERSMVASTLHHSLDGDATTEAVAEGFVLGNYRFTKHKSDPHPSKLDQVQLPGADPQRVARATAIGEATLLARDLSNEPPNALTPEALARKAQEVADVNGVECTVWDEDMLRKRGFGGLLGVARGSELPPRFIEMRYRPDSPRGLVALVGKGVTFDSGGLSLKDAKSMETMKADMAGAAAVIATMGTLKKIDAHLEVMAFIPTTENLPGGTAIKPGEVIRHYDGRTTEVNNTDAEGRLILADALAYAAEQNPDAIVDVATLTGGIMIALGLKSSGLFTNDDELCRELEAAAVVAGERVWRMPIYDDYQSDLSSEVADTKNSGPRWGSPIIGAVFLQAHVPEGIPWAHLDIAGADWAEKAYDEGPKGATGAATRTLIRWIERRGSGGNG
ncbi:MAG: leucyl aminopeptidase [Actinomycetota bacterium]|nr:leucyl aminopeptidase [Actinomycetota bacterium]